MKHRDDLQERHSVGPLLVSLTVLVTSILDYQRYNHVHVPNILTASKVWRTLEQ